jgi:hypothetical protein
MKITKVLLPSCKLLMDYQVFLVHMQDSLVGQCENGLQNMGAKRNYIQVIKHETTKKNPK